MSDNEELEGSEQDKSVDGNEEDGPGDANGGMEQAPLKPRRKYLEFPTYHFLRHHYR